MVCLRNNRLKPPGRNGSGQALTCIPRLCPAPVLPQPGPGVCRFPSPWHRAGGTGCSLDPRPGACSAPGMRRPGVRRGNLPHGELPGSRVHVCVCVRMHVCPHALQAACRMPVPLAGDPMDPSVPSRCRPARPRCPASDTVLSNLGGVILGDCQEKAEPSSGTRRSRIAAKLRSFPGAEPDGMKKQNAT